MVLSMARPWEHPKTGVFYLRVRVPSDLVGRVGKSVEKRSLFTKDPAEARVAFASALSLIQARWGEIRKGVQTLTDRQIHALAGEVYLAFRARQPAEERSWPAETQHSFMRWGLEMALGEEPYPPGHAYESLPVWRRAEIIVGDDSRAVLARHGIEVDDYTHQRFMVASARAMLLAIKQTLRESQGDWRPDPDADRFPKVDLPSAGPTRSNSALDVETFWDSVSVEFKPNTRKRWRAILDRLLASVGHTDVARLRREDIEAWRDDTLAKGSVSHRTFARNDLTAVKTMLKRAVAEKLLTTSPAADVAVTKKTGKRYARQMRDIYDDEAILVLAKTLEPPSPRLARHTAAARRWVPWLCAYTGARVNEITQARGGDVVKIDGYWCISITPEAGTTKSDRARFVPLHEHLIDQGFVDFAKAHGNGQRLFAAAKDGKRTTAAEMTGGKLAEWVRDIVQDPNVWPNHGWRHRFETELRFARIEEMFIDAIQGHANKTQGREYGTFPPRVLGPLIARLPRLPVETGPVGPGAVSKAGAHHVPQDVPEIRLP